jgi:hypothetical protein
MEIQRIAYLEYFLKTVIDCLAYLIKYEHHLEFFHPDSITAQQYRLEYYNSWLFYFFKLEMLIASMYFQANLVIYDENTSRKKHRKLDHRLRSS